MWNLGSMLLERQYLGEQLYFSVVSPARSLRDEYNIPDNALLCGIVKDLPKPSPYGSGMMAEVAAAVEFGLGWIEC
ncbi:hypothetical protein RJ639_018627 [Escallonia herrerae]|nr:hypothetical protein RJ639_021408 [Escallonia herrerae]KAK3003458.1 hypothetical protein RJ639_018627 [Escallonia herrerae]